MAAFIGTWNVVKSRTEGAAAFATALDLFPSAYTGVPNESLAVMDKLDISVTISKKGLAWRFDIDLHGAAPNQGFTATPGVPLKSKNPDGSNTVMTLTVDHDMILESYDDEQRGKYTITRTLSNGDMVVTSLHGTAKMVQYCVRAS